MLWECLWYDVWKTSTLIYPYKSPIYHLHKVLHSYSALFPSEYLICNVGHNVGTRDGKKEAQKIDIVWTDETGHKELKN